MDPYVTGEVIRSFREKNKMTHVETAVLLSKAEPT